ncbi:hypothetical protein DRP53_02440 [candidate division WOR-3 bacterium]|uniref:Uncharacterized protein n=1 Tax=candidate division WOR-3 bacterium TaxID=2052148 RepID=A0A660SK54_UNCW3|nr:MAG: hypothetical protein DRP53_02440 [candidate division WOR-3 bacterium]
MGKERFIEPPSEKQEAILRRMSGEERMRIGFEICDFVRKLVISGIRYQYPDISEEELKEKIKERYREL